MPFYTTMELDRGLGAFEHAMRSQTEVPGHGGKVSPGVAVGVLAAMMSSGLTAKRIENVIQTSFEPIAPRLRQILNMYQGDSWDIHLWHLLPTGRYKLCTDLCQKVHPDWRYDPSLQADL